MALHMSEEEFLSLGIQPEEEGFDALNQRLDDVEGSIRRVDAAVQSVGEASEQPLERMAAKFAQTNAQIQETNESLAQMRQNLGDMPDTGGEDGGGGGGMFGLSRGFSSAGMLARRAGATGLGEGLQDVGAFLRVEQAVGRLEDQMTNLPGIFGQVATEGEALGGGLGSVLAVAAPLAVAIGAVSVAFKVFITDTLEPANKALEEAKTSVDEYYAAIGKGTRESLQKQLDDLESQKKSVDEKVATITNALGSGFGSAQQQFGDLGARLITAGENAGAFGGGVKDLNKDLDDAKKQSEELQGKIDGVTRAMGSSAVSANDAAEAEKKLQEARDKQADKNIQSALQTAQLEQTGTSKGVQDRINAIEAERNAIVNELGAQQVSLDKRIELGERLGELGEEEGKLTDTVLPLVQAREAEEKAAKDTQKEIDNITRAHETYQKAIESAKTSLDNQIQTARFRESQQEEANQIGSPQDTQAREKIRTDEGRKEIELEQQTADQLLNIQQNYSDNVAKAVRSAQMQQQVDEMDHEQRLAQIRQEAQSNEADDIANRDFAKLAKDQQSAQKRETQEDQTFALQEKKLAMHLQEQENEMALAEQRQEAQTVQNEQRKLETLRQSAQYQLDDLTTAEGYKIQILRVGLQNEIALYQMQEQQRLQIAMQTQNAIIANAQAQIARLNSNTGGGFAFANSMNDAINSIGEALFGS